MTPLMAVTDSGLERRNPIQSAGGGGIDGLFDVPYRGSLGIPRLLCDFGL